MFGKVWGLEPSVDWILWKEFAFVVCVGEDTRDETIKPILWTTELDSAREIHSMLCPLEIINPLIILLSYCQFLDSLPAFWTILFAW